jgi:hypothetical protein
MEKTKLRGVAMHKDDLIEEGNKLLKEEWENTFKKQFMDSIDEAIKRGNADTNVLWVMKELLDDGVIVRPRKKTIEEYFEEQERLNKE